jgi:hypothetical protein
MRFPYLTASLSGGLQSSTAFYNEYVRTFQSNQLITQRSVKTPNIIEVRYVSNKLSIININCMWNEIKYLSLNGSKFGFKTCHSCVFCEWILKRCNKILSMVVIYSGRIRKFILGMQEKPMQLNYTYCTVSLEQSILGFTKEKISFEVRCWFSRRLIS